MMPGPICLNRAQPVAGTCGALPFSAPWPELVSADMRVKLSPRVVPVTRRRPNRDARAPALPHRLSAAKPLSGAEPPKPQ
ncbi:hypothetical protein GCM10020366_66260 [Saccharopolyspora gregorii]|uniref:Uncharacterized protein n=1 Tax=Saccharopolyspora gregorii TaxID=33914 RepID=A0ABP6S1N1_9PSEU